MTEIAASLALLAMTRQVALLLNLSLRGEAVAISILDKRGDDSIFSIIANYSVS
jgi:hypothetical protein